MALTSTGSEGTGGSSKPDRPRWRPLPVDRSSPWSIVPAFISLLVWPALRMLVEFPPYLFRRLFSR
jgi:hypothetical protein